MNKMKIEIVKDNRLWQELHEQAQRSNCLRRKVSAACVNVEGRYKIISNNSVINEINPCEPCYRQQNDIKSGTMYETCRAIHAEQKVIMNAGKDLTSNQTMYIYGHNFICLMCKRAIVEAGIKDVYLRESMDHDVQYFTREDIINTKGL